MLCYVMFELEYNEIWEMQKKVVKRKILDLLSFMFLCC